MHTILNLCQEIRAIEHAKMHWRSSVVRLAAVANFELRNLRLAARVPGADRDELLTQVDRLEVEVDQALKTHEGEGR